MGRSKYFNNISEPISSPEEEGRYGAQQPSNWPKTPGQPRQYQNYTRPQNFYPTGNNTSNRNYNQDYRPYERSYDNRYSTVPHGQGEKRPFYEGANGRNNRPHNQHVSTTTSGLNFKEKSSLDNVLQSYRPTRQYEYDDRSNGRYSPQVERSYPQPVNRPYYTPRVSYQRSVSENCVNRYRDLSQPQKSGYFDKLIMPQNRPASPVDFRYPAQNRTSDPMPEILKPSPNEVRFTPSDQPTTPEPRREINKILSDHRIRKYLESNHKRYLVLHSNGKVEHVDSLDSIVQQYTNYVMVKAGDIVTNPHNSSLELKPPTLRGEILSIKIPDVMQRIQTNPNDFPTYGYNLRVPYVTEKVYAQPISKPVNIPHEDEANSSDEGIIIMTTSASTDTLTNFVETMTEYYTHTPFLESTTEYGTLIPLSKTTTEFGTQDKTTRTASPFVETKTDYKAYAYSTTESAKSSIPITIENQHQTQIPIEVLSEDLITVAPFLVTTEDYSTLKNVMLTKNNVRELFPSAFGKFIQQNFGTILTGNKLNTAIDDQSKRRLGNAESTTDPFNVTTFLHAITELATANLSTTERAERSILYNDDSKTSFSFTDNIIDTTSILTSSLYDEDQTAYPETPLMFSENEELVNILSSFVNTNDESTQHNEHKNNHHRNPGQRKSTENSYYPMASVNDDDNDDKSVLYTTAENINNPFTSFGDVYADPSSEDESVYSTETAVYDPSNPFSVKRKEDITNPFFESLTTHISKQLTRIRNKKRLNSITENYRENFTNPFFALLNTTDNGIIPNEGIPDYIQDCLDENGNETILNPFMDTNPFNDDLQNTLVTNEGYAPNPFTGNYADEITLTQTEVPITFDIPLVFEESENIYKTNIVPFPYNLPSENGAYELAASIPDNDINTISDDFNEFHDTSKDKTEKPTVWLKTGGDFWEKLFNETVPYDVVYLFPVHAQPLVKKDTKTTIFPNGTIVREFSETVWEREGDSAPLLVKSTKTVYPDEEPRT